MITVSVNNVEISLQSALILSPQGFVNYRPYVKIQ